MSLRFVSLHYTTLRYITLHYTPLHYSTLHYTAQHYNYNYTTTLHYAPVHSTTLNYTALHYITLHCTPLHYTTLPSILAFCFSADLQWSEHPSPFWTFHAAVPLVKAASYRNYMVKYMFFSGLFATHPNYLFQWMKPLLKVMMFLHQIDKV